MPWLPEFRTALRLAHQTPPTQAPPGAVEEYLSALEAVAPQAASSDVLVTVVVHDPQEGRISGHDDLARFMWDSAAWRERLRARSEPVAATAAEGRAVLELLAHLVVDGRQVALPVAVVAEAGADGHSAEFRIYHSLWPLLGRHQLRPPILGPGGRHPGDVVGRYHAALGAGDAAAIVAVFEPDGYFREPAGPQYTYRGTAELQRLYTEFLAAGGIGLEHCSVTDDGTRCALEFNAVRWGTVQMPRQAGVAVYERGASGLLAAARVYDDVDPPL
jgi:hypothetical protein